MVYGLSMGTLNWLKSATLSDLRNVARSGHPCVRLVVKPAALWQSATVSYTHLDVYKRQGREAAAAVSATARKQGIRTLIVKSPKVGTDIADLLEEMAT